ncbi:MAG: thiamine phosphate synthase [Xanthobacteraceae bacterium]
MIFDALDLRLYAIVDPETSGGRPLPELAGMVAAGGATLIQLRDKLSDTRTMIERARAIKAVLPREVPLIINDRIDVMLEAGADGVHLGQDDGNVVAAREKLGPAPFIGLTVQTIEHARAVPLAIIDYVGIGGVYATSSKNNPRPPIGIVGLRRIVEVFRYRIGNFPMCAIAGITKNNAAETIMAGVDGVSVISALSLAPDPTAAARELRGVVDAALVARAPLVPDTRERADAPGHAS